MDTSRTRICGPLTGAVTVLALLTLAACGTEPGSDAGRDATVKPDLQLSGIDWTVDSVTVDGKKTPAPEKATVRIDDKGRASGNTGCNHFGADVKVKGDTVTVGPARTTQIGCPKSVAKFERHLQRTFAGELKAKVADDRLTLTTAEGDTIALSETKPEPDAELLGTEWRVESLRDGDTASSLPEDAAAKAKLFFGEDGSVGGNLGCNNVSGKVKVSGSTLTFSKIATTRKLCPPAVMNTEEALLEVLEGEAEYEIRERALTLTGADGKGLEAMAIAR
ncbi:META domain-containing protein [Streptomyces albidochromogenes]|uniref:META domain-containing protein n=1 Tax=Streptomyces albidochromogenes TaxID=329524 RepID=UPI00110FE69E|nr:META domain-containing protein [Streptomyces albidochromogenes]